MIGLDVSGIVALHPVSPTEGKQNPVQQTDRPERRVDDRYYCASGDRIGDHSMVGAGSRVAQEVEVNTIVVGSAARVFRNITEEDDPW